MQTISSSGLSGSSTSAHAPGNLGWLEPELVEIPANFGLEKGVWFHINEGLQGIVVHDEHRRPHVYMLTQAASHYYPTMTKHDRMPLLVGQEI